MKLINSLIKKIKGRIREEYILLTKFGPIQRKWLRFLKNNPEIQEKRQLGKKDVTSPLGYRACCLGQFGLMTGICKWSTVTRNLMDLTDNSHSFPLTKDMIKYGFRDKRGNHIEEEEESLSSINDTGTWLDVYNACINNPKGYFTKKV